MKRNKIIFKIKMPVSVNYWFNLSHTGHFQDKGIVIRGTQLNSKIAKNCELLDIAKL